MAETTKKVAFKDLTKKEKKHLKEDGNCVTLGEFKVLAAAQKEMRQKMTSEPCHCCKAIARKLGLEV